MLLDCESIGAPVDEGGPCCVRTSQPARPDRKKSSERSDWLAREVMPHEPMLRQWLFGKLRCPVAVDDVVQDIFLRLGQTASVDHIAAPRNYLWSTAISVLRDRARRARVAPSDFADSEELVELPCEAPSPFRQLCAREELETVLGHIASLPERTRQVLVLRRLELLSLAETASLLGISPSAVEKHQRRAHRYLKEKLPCAN
ncbi:MAG: RNA polymerase sigma factor [Sphingomonas sp.]|nr:RNA polymerase sigma factor [Sphingomonas sp.]